MLEYDRLFHLFFKGFGPNRLISSVISAAEKANCPPIAADTLIIWIRWFFKPIVLNNSLMYSTLLLAWRLPSR